MPGYSFQKKNFKEGTNLNGFICWECDLLLREPVQIACGHRLCKSCADELLQSGLPAQCPVQDCRELIEDEDGAKVSLFV